MHYGPETKSKVRPNKKYARSRRPDQTHRNSCCRRTSLFSNRCSHQYQTAPVLANRSDRLVRTGRSPVQHHRHHIPEHSIRPRDSLSLARVRGRSQGPPHPTPCGCPLRYPQGRAHQTHGRLPQRKLQQLISGEELGDRKPTQLLRRMQQLLGDYLGPSTDNNAFLKELFLQRLPANVRMVLASADDTTDLAKLADMADKVIEVAAPSVSAIAHTSDDTEVEKLRAEVTRLAELVTSLTRHRDRSQSRGRRTHSLAPTDPLPQPQDRLCWYHKKFGEAAKCQEPCSWRNA